MCSNYTAAILDDLQTFLKEKYTAAMDLWLDLGVSHEMAQERLKKAVGHVRVIVEDMLEEEVQMKERVMVTIQECLEEVQVLRRQLQLPEVELESGLTPLVKEEYLRDQVEKLTHIRIERFRRLKKLQNEEHCLCKKLGMAHHTLSSTDPVPSEEDLQELLQHIRMLEDESERRLAQVSGLRREISVLLEELGETPEPGPRRDLICEDIEVLQLSLEMVRAAKEYLATLQKLKVQKTAEHKELVDKLSSYWDRLEVSQEHRESFLSQQAGLKPSNFEALREETARCEAMKRERLAEFVDRTKKELVEWYDRCGVPERKTRLEVATDWDEDYLGQLENELSYMKGFYDKHQGLFEKVARREALWAKLRVLQKKMHDPHRFKNRGGALLQEERERNRLLKELPKLEDEISSYMELEEHATDPLFSMWSAGFNAHLHVQHEEYKEGKENEKLERMKNKLQTPSTIRGVKRPGSATPIKGSSKISRLAAGTPVSAMTRRNSPKLPISALKRSILRRSREKANRGGKATPLVGSARQPLLRTPLASATTTSDNLASSTVASYKEFTAALVQPKAAIPVNSTFVTQQNGAGGPQQHKEGSR